MSWFDTSGFASLAKTALKEAQKTIDKALDIKDEDQKHSTAQPASDSTDFFKTWGVANKEGNQEKELSASQKQQGTSIWGSFSGSFFENPQDNMTAISNERAESFKDSINSIDKLQSSLVSSKSLPESLTDRLGITTFSESTVVHSPTDIDISVVSKSQSSEELGSQVFTSGKKHEAQSDLAKFQELINRTDKPSTSAKIHADNKLIPTESNETIKKSNIVARKKDHVASHSLNRLSVLSVESDKRSSESIEILSSQSHTNTDCTNSPESDLNSLSASIGPKKSSESVEVLPDSILSSPSSVETLDDWKSDESPYMSPINEKLLETYFTPIPADIKSSSIIVDSIQQDISKAMLQFVSGEVDETTVKLIIKLLRQKEQAVLEMHDLCSDTSHTLLTSIASDDPLTLSLDSLKEKSNLTNLHLPMDAITKQPIRKSEYADLSQQPSNLESPFERLKSSTIEPPEPKKSDNLDLSSGVLTDSSCEETLIGSSSEENASSKQQPLTSSSYVKSMLAEAMSDKAEQGESERHEVPRDNSPISSESRSDLVKIGSDQTSGHTSGDELETTTSSDIEIISSPNGDSSSTQSRQSPAKLQSYKSSDLLTKTLKIRGHSRELSEISVGSDDANLEIERLLRRIREMTEILEARESKLFEVSRTNMELHEQNSALKKELDNVEKHAEQNQDLSQITDEYTQRLSALERKFQQAIRERDSLRKHLEQMKQEALMKVSTVEMSTVNVEKDEIIKELREEGEKLSKQQLQHSNIIKKLRAKYKENETLIQNQKEQLDEQASELERLKRSLHAKEEVERSQIEAVHTLTAKCKKQEKEILSLNEQLDNVTNKMEAYKKSFDVAKSELLDTKEKLTDAEENLKLAVDNVGESHQLLAQVNDLKLKLRQTEEAHVKKEKTLKQENMELLKRHAAAESRTEEMSESVSQATKPLLRQIEQMHSSLSQKTNMFMRQEEAMTEKIADLQAKLDTLGESNRSLGEENTNLKSRCSVLESKLNMKETDRKQLHGLNESLKEENKKLTNKNEVHQQAMKMLEESHSTEIKELKREISSLENKIAMEKAAVEAEKRKNNTILEQQHSVDEELRYSPTLSIERDSVSSANSIWPTFNDAMFESSSGKFPNVYDSFRSGSNSTSMIENLQAQLKQRDGEVQQLQWELSRRNTERDALNNEVSSLASKVEDLNSTVSDMESIKENLNDIQTKYDALLQMYGEKVEENQELLLDLQDVKELYKTQIDQLLETSEVAAE